MDYSLRLYSLFMLQLAHQRMAEDPSLTLEQCILALHKEALKVEQILQRTH